MLEDELDVKAELIVGSNGIFEVAVDGKVVAAKTRSGFPEERDLVDAVARALPA